jgi:ATP synthase protein I
MFFFPKGSGPNALDVTFRLGSIGIHLVVCTFVGLAVGYYLDKWLDTRPWLTLLFLVFGIAAGFKNIYEETKRLQREQDKPRNDDDTPEN